MISFSIFKIYFEYSNWAIFTFLTFSIYSIVCKIVDSKLESYSASWYVLKTYLYTRYYTENRIRHVYLRYFQLWILCLAVGLYQIYIDFFHWTISIFLAFIFGLIATLPRVKKRKELIPHTIFAVVGLITPLILLSSIKDNWSGVFFTGFFGLMAMAYAKRPIIVIEIIIAFSLFFMIGIN